MSMSSDTLDLLADTKEVAIETTGDGRSYRTIIWVGVEGGDVFVRSVRGDSGRWYQRAVADRDVALIAGDRRIPLRVVPASDPESIERASEALRHKYPKGGSLDRMLAGDVLHTTLRLEPV